MVENKSQIVRAINAFFEDVIHYMDMVLFYDIMGFPFIVLWLILGGIFFTFRLKFVNIRLFRHGIDCVRGKYSSPNDPGEITHFKALAAAVSATVGLGNIAGVAFAVGLGGPGAIFWMMVGGFAGMSLKFAEVTLGQKYRIIGKDGKVSGGGFHYLEQGLAELNMPKIGKFLAVIFAFACFGGALGSGNMFQANQSIALLTNTFEGFGEMKFALSIALAVLVGTIIIGGITRIANVASKVVPLMAIIYVISCFIILGVNFSLIPNAISAILSDAFTGEAMGGGLIGVIIMGFRRSTFSNEAGTGSAAIAHAAAKTKEPVREGCVALLEPFIDTIVICFMTGLVIVTTGVYQTNMGDTSTGAGVLLTANSFATVSTWFPYILSVCVVLFAFSTIITWSYYGEKAWQYLFGYGTTTIYHLIFVAATFAGGVINATMIMDLADLLFFTMAIPNLIGLYLLSGKIMQMMRDYEAKLKAGKFKKI